MNRKLVSAMVAIVALVGLAGCSSSPPTSTSGKVQLTMWMNGGCTGCVEVPLVKAFEKANPNIKIKIVAEPSSSYFAALQSASVTGTGPDLASMFAGTYMDQFEKYMVDAHKFVSSKLIAEAPSINYFSAGNDSKNTVYAIPNEDQFYIGYYNKKIFADNGIKTVPTTWSQLMSDSAILSKAGVLPIVNGATGGAAQMNPLFEWAYLAAALPASKWTDLFNGKLKYNDPVLQEQLTRWADLYKAGYINKDAFNFPNTQDAFTSGKAAMLLGDGSWDIPAYQKAMGNNLGVIVPPYTTTDKHSLVEMAGNGYAVMKYSKHQADAGKFQAFMLSDAGQKIIAKTGQPAIRPGFPTTFATLNQLSAMSVKPDTTHYPMFDNLSQSAVTTAIQSSIGQVLVGQTTPSAGLAAIDSAFSALPSDQKKLDIPLK